MKEIRSILQAYQQINQTNEQVALATVVHVEGSSYRRIGARMLISSNGSWVGGISGGCLEGDALKKARLAIAKKQATMVRYDTTDDDPFQIGVGLGCNGIIDVLLTPIDTNKPNNAITILSDIVVRRTTSVLITVLNCTQALPFSTGQVFELEPFLAQHKSLLHPSSTEALVQAVTEAFTQQKSQVYRTQQGECTLLLEVLLPPVHLVIYGGNYDIYPLVRLAKELGWLVTVVCNPLKMQAQLSTWADAIVPKEEADTIAIDERTAAILMAHDYETDFTNLQRLLPTVIPFIGLLGPKKRTQKMFDAMQQQGKVLNDSELERISSPVGLDIGATTPEEIGLSILAEVRTHFAQRAGGRLKWRNAPIYD